MEKKQNPTYNLIFYYEDLIKVLQIKAQINERDRKREKTWSFNSIYAWSTRIEIVFLLFKTLGVS